MCSNVKRYSRVTVGYNEGTNGVQLGHITCTVRVHSRYSRGTAVLVVRGPVWWCGDGVCGGVRWYMWWLCLWSCVSVLCVVVVGGGVWCWLWCVVVCVVVGGVCGVGVCGVSLCVWRWWWCVW